MSERLPNTYKAPIACNWKSVGPSIRVPIEWKMSEERIRYDCNGSKGNRVGDIITVWNRKGRWQKATSYDLRHGIENGQMYPAVITQRYYTKNYYYKNYHARVKLLDGKHAGKCVSVRY